jgi:hypothetical protein
VRIEIFIQEQYTGIDTFQTERPDCSNELFMTFDMKLSQEGEDDVWKELWNHWETSWITEYNYDDTDYEQKSLDEGWFEYKHFWIFRTKPFYKLYIQFSQADFENEF